MNTVGPSASGNFSSVNSFQSGRKESNNKNNKRRVGETRQSEQKHVISNDKPNRKSNMRPFNKNGKGKSFSKKSNLKHNTSEEQQKQPVAIVSNPHSSSSSPEKSANPTKKTNRFASQFVGALLLFPDQFGYQKINHVPRITPKYLLPGQTLFESTSFVPNEWDRKNQEMLAARESEFEGDPQMLFQEFQDDRKKERQMMESLNLVDKENAKKSLDAAISFRGSCLDMCPTFERVERQYKNQVSKWEKDSMTGRISRHYAIKTFMRPSGQPPPLPSDVRAPHILSKTLDYIIDNLLLKMPDSQSFIWDRTRSIRQDFTFQNNYSGIESIDCHEKICRIHILSLHVMAGAHDPDYQQQQELEQFNNSMQTLTYMYKDVRSRGGFCPNEPEFRAYELISKVDDTELDRNLQQLPESIISAPILQRALMLRGLILRGIGNLNLYTQFFEAALNGETPFLLACMSEIHFNEVRYNALKIMSRSLHSKSKSLPDARILVADLGFDTLEEFLKTCKLYSLPVIHDSENIPRVEVSAFNTAFKHSQAQPYTIRINDISHGSSYKDIVNSGLPNYALNLASAKHLEEVARESFREGKEGSRIIADVLKGASHVSIPQAVIKAIKKQPDAFGITTEPPRSTVPSFDPQPSQEQSASSLFGGTLAHGSATPFNPGSLFNSTRPKLEFSSPSLQKSRPPKPIQQPFQITENASIPQSLAQTPVKPLRLPAAPSKEPNPPVSLPKRKLLGLPEFDTAAKEVVDDTIHHMISKITPQLVERAIKNATEVQQNHREQLVGQLTEELYSAFMREQIYLFALKVRAQGFREKKLKLWAVQRLIHAARRSSIKNKEKNERLIEVDTFRNNVTTPLIASLRAPRTGFYTPKDPTGPIDISLLLEKSQIQLSQMRMLTIARNWNASTSKWIANKLGLKQIGSEDELTAEWKSSKTALKIHSLSDSFDPKTDFRRVDFVVIQVGTLEANRHTDKYNLKESLEADGKVVAKVLEYLRKYNKGYYTSVLVTFFDCTDFNFTDSEVIEYLKLDSYSTDVHDVTIEVVNLSTLFALQYVGTKRQFSSAIFDMLGRCHSKELDLQRAEEESTRLQSTTIDEASRSSNGQSLIGLMKGGDRLASQERRRRYDKKRVHYIKSQLSETGKSMFRIRLKRKRREEASNTSWLTTSNSTNELRNISLLSTTSSPISTGRFYLPYSEEDNSQADNNRKKKVDELTALADSILNDS
ncbi:hypothetical protein FOA43_003264 [Brettanomyces nanus]|uniref:Nuclear mRNA export factor n=1 Tax=Eeniella nana TaxID=13502 RepID=A0A875S4J9_EENNA|nr:uncharacterized protein FOA43_003264 [Brettanomyces nanus]QPG75878.1 hypothetical protein FOA43_003264 [Brettanomyces nanus]